MKKGKVIFFDFDGTICDTKGYVHDILFYVLDEIDFRVNKSDIEKEMGKKLDHMLLSLGVDSSIVASLAKRFYNLLMGGVSRDRISLCCPIEPLKDLKDAGYRLVIVTNNNAEFVKRALGVFRIKSLFSAVYGDSDFSTKGEMLSRLVKRYGLSSEKVYYVGDRFSDIDFAHEAHLIAVAVHNDCSVSSKERVLRERPEHIVSDFEGLKKIIMGREK